MICNEDRVVQLEALSYPAHERVSVYMKSKPSPAMKQTEALFAQILVHSIHCSTLFPFQLPASTSVDGKHIPLLGGASHLVCMYNIHTWNIPTYIWDSRGYIFSTTKWWRRLHEVSFNMVTWFGWSKNPKTRLKS